MGRLVIVSPISYIEDEINKIIISEFTAIFKDIAIGIEDDIRKNIRPIFENSETYQEMITALSNLNVEIGIPATEAKSKWSEIFELLTNQIYISFNPLKVVGGIVEGGIIVDIIKSDFKEIIDSSFGHFITEKGFDLPWQEWLLIEGDSLVIADHHVRFVNPLKKSKYFFSRTGGAIMAKKGSWKVPDAHSGTIDNNWLTKVIQTYFDFIEKFVYQSFKTRLENAL